MATKAKSSGMKSAYEAALERLDREGIERPSAAKLGAATKEAIAAARRLTESKLAELEILHRDKVAKATSATDLAAQEEFYRRERERLVREGDARVAKLRGA